MMHGQASKAASHFWYICDSVPAAKRFCAPDGACLVEIRSNGQMTILPPSVHPSGETYAFDCDDAPGRIEVAELCRKVARLAAAALLARHWPAKGQRHDASLALAGMLLRASWNEDDVAKFVEAVAKAAGDEEAPQRTRDVVSTAKRLAAGRETTGGKTLATLFGNDVVTRVCDWLWLPLHAKPRVSVPANFSEQIKWPDALAKEAFHGLVGEIVAAIEPHSEADPAALLMQLLVVTGNAIGRGPFFMVEEHQHNVNLFTVIVGLISKARKGTSWSRIAALLGAVDSFWTENRIHGGVASGEGIVWHVRDPILKRDKLVDDGIEDKRLLLLESEFAQPLAVIERQGNTTSEILRRAWDGTPLQTLTKNNSARATGAHISMIGHVTRDELLRHLSQTEIANGLANRFIFCLAERSKTLPEGSDLDHAQLSPLIEKLRAAIAFARDTGEMKRDPEARRIWREVYPELSQGKPGLLGAVTSRAEAQVLRLSMVYALLNCPPEICCEHLQGALAVWDYAESSCRYIFGDALGDPVADDILRALRAKPEGLTRSEIRDFFGRHRSEAEISRALGTLLQDHLVSFFIEETPGRPVEHWFTHFRGCDKSDLSDRRAV